MNVTDYFARVATNPDPVVAAGYAPKEESSPALSMALSSAQSQSFLLALLAVTHQLQEGQLTEKQGCPF